MPDIRDWIGRSETSEDVLELRPARFLEATLDHEPRLVVGDALPPLWHWLYFLEALPMRELGRDGHPRKGGFLPPVSLPRRMWAGGRFEFQAPLSLGMRVRRVSKIKDVVEKAGRSGKLCFVTVVHEISGADGAALREEHDIVYREDLSSRTLPAVPGEAPGNAEFSEEIRPSPILLFRYSALTFNGHRIHYDADYARDTEGYAGLVIHGPLIATLLAGLAERRLGAQIRRFSFRGHAPLAGMDPFRIEGRRDGDAIALWARRHDGALAMSALAEA